jgi:Flp pilus assembly protein TadD
MLTKRRLSHARGYLELGMVAEAEAELAHLTGPDAELPEALTLRLAVRHEQEDWPAVRDLARALVRHESAEAAVWVTLAYATRRADSLIAAEIILLQAEKHFPQEATIQFNLGCYACQRGDVKEARRRVGQAITLEEKFREIAATDPDLAPLREAHPGDFAPEKPPG